MAFLFKSKKNAEKAQASREAVAGSQSALIGGTRPQNDKGAVQPVSTTPGSSVNNSISSLPGGGTVTPSPEQPNGRKGTGSEMGQDSALRNGSALAVQQTSAPDASLYPWLQRRIQYTTSHPSPFPRYGAAVNSSASKEGDIYLMGGLINSSTVKGDLWMLEAGGNMACYPLATTAEGPGPRVGHASLLVGNAFIVYGGDTKMEDSDVLDETLYLLNTSTRQWSRAVPAGPRPSGRYGHSLNILGSKIYVFGGQVEGYFMNDLVAFDLNQLQIPTNRWEILIRNSDEGGLAIGKVPPPRTNHSVVTYNEKLYLFGGTNGFQWFNDVWCYDPMPNTWSALDCIGYIPAPREGHAAAIVEDVMYIFGGRTEEGSDLGDLAAFRITTRRWYTFQNMGPSPSPRSGHSMTSHGKNVIVLAGEPSTATEAQDLTIVYLLNTSKIRYPNDQQIQQAPSGDRAVSVRRPSTGEKSLSGPPSRGPLLAEQHRTNGPPRESVMVQNWQAPRMNDQPGVNGNDLNGVAPGSAQPQGPQGSKLPRASLAQAPAGSPPPQAALAPRVDGAVPVSGRGQTPTKMLRGFGPPIDTGIQRAPSPPLQTRTMSPASKQGGPSTKENSHDQLTQQTKSTIKPVARQDTGEVPSLTVNATPRSTSKTTQARQQGSVDSIVESTVKSAPTRHISPPPSNRQANNPLARKNSRRSSQIVGLLKELDVVKNRNAWYASELELARKAGYTTHSSTSPALDQSAADSFDDEDKPLIEALLAMKSELANVQSSIDKQAVLAAKQIAEVEKQRDAAVNEVVYAKAKLAAHGGSQGDTPQPDSKGRDVGMMSSNRSTDIGRKLATAIQVQRDLTNELQMVTAELEAEKKARTLAEDTASTAQSRMADLEAYKQQNSAEVERLKAELHDLQKKVRQEAIVCAEAVSATQILRIEKKELDSRYMEALDTSKEQGDTFNSLREAVNSSLERGNVLERKLNEERSQRDEIESKLAKLKTEHELQASELASSTRKLRDAEELAGKHASEAQKHCQVVLAGLDKVATREIGTVSASTDERSVALQAQVEAANALVRKHQTEADTASEKLRSAEERIAGLEAYQEQVSREGMSIRKQLQNTMREVQSLQAANQEVKHKLANQQLETNAAHVQHNTLKDILVERGISPTGALRARGITSPASSYGADQARVRDLEHQLAMSLQSHEETKRSIDTQSQDSERAYREKLSQLESDYQSAVHYVKGTEKMLKRMKEELAKYKAENGRLKDQLVEVEENSSSKGAPPNWEDERTSLNRQIDTLQAEIKSSVHQLETRMAQVRTELVSAQKERDQLQQINSETQRQFASSSEQARADLSALQSENAKLEQRAHDAEQKVSLLLDQVEHSVDTYRRQSRQPEGVPPGHSRNISGTESISDSSTSVGNRNSMALDSLASELETLRTHWETTRDKSYGRRISGAFDFEDLKTPRFGGGLEQEWRRRLDEEDNRGDRLQGPRIGGLKISPVNDTTDEPAVGKEMDIGLGKENSPSKREMNHSDVTPT